MEEDTGIRGQSVRRELFTLRPQHLLVLIMMVQKKS